MTVDVELLATLFVLACGWLVAGALVLAILVNVRVVAQADTTFVILAWPAYLVLAVLALGVATVRLAARGLRNLVRAVRLRLRPPPPPAPPPPAPVPPEPGIVSRAMRDTAPLPPYLDRRR